MSPQHSNRSRLLEGAIRCLEQLPAEAVTARVIAAEAQANIASIGYHFESKDGLLAEAMAEGFRRWLAEIATGLADIPPDDTSARLQRSIEIVADGRRQHAGLARAFLSALARAPHDPRVRVPLADSYRQSRVALAKLLGLGADEAGDDAAAVLLATFDGLLIQALLDPARALNPERVETAQRRLAALTATTCRGT